MKLTTKEIKQLLKEDDPKDFLNEFYVVPLDFNISKIRTNKEEQGK